MVVKPPAILAEYAAQCAALHRRFALWKQPCPNSLYALLAAYDSMILPKLRGPSAEHTLGSIQLWKSLDEAFAQAVRWHLATCGPTEVQPCALREVIEDAAELLFHARDYFSVEYFHRRLGLGLVNVAVDESTRSVRFVPIFVEPMRRATLASG